MKAISDSIDKIKSAFDISVFNSFIFTTISETSSDRFSQEDVIRSILVGKDTLAIIPTGGGKSICFQGPAICFPGLTIVITPLVALIKDQVNNLNSTMNEAFEEGRISKRYKAIFPGMNNLSTADLIDEIVSPADSSTEYKLLYLSPERLAIPKFTRLIKEMEEDGSLYIDQIVVDEVHCLSQWGFDFRESYLNILNFIDSRPKRPVISAFTATATPQDIEYIKVLLGFDVQKKKGKFSYYENIETRENLKLDYKVCNDGGDRVNAPTRWETLKSIFEKHGVSDGYRSPATIVYCTTVKQVEYLYDKLLEEKVVQPERLCMYHAQMNESSKQTNSDRFIKYDHNVIIATKAFGMGIDKENIGLIIHFDIPLCLEEYYQEIGRAGRGKNKNVAYCYLLYSFGNPVSEDETPPLGSYLFTKIWINSDLRNLAGLESKPIESRLTAAEKKAIIYLAKYRFLAVKNYCFLKPANSEIRQKYITDYLREKIHDSSFMMLKKDEDVTIDDAFLKSLKDDDDKYMFNSLIKDLKRYIKGVNELNINNTKIANILRWHPDAYELNTSKNDIEIIEWKRKKRTKYKTILSPDIQFDSAFIRSSNVDDSKLLSNVNTAWKQQLKKHLKKSRYLFIVDSNDELCKRVFSYSGDNNEWGECPDDDPIIEKMISRPTTITGLFNKSRYADWRTRTIEDFVNLLNNDKETVPDYSPFAYIRGQRARNISFTLHGKDSPDSKGKPDYFDMCVLDAVYSIGSNGFKTVYVNKIWEILTGDPSIKFSRSDSAIKTAIINSINKLMNLKISISDSALGEDIDEETFLPLRKKPAGELGYYYLDTPPLFKYAEEINGEIIRVPISLMAVHLGKRNSFKPHALTEDLDNYRYVWKANIENCVLCHYILHRLSISRGKNRGNYISFCSLKKILINHLKESMNRDSGFLYLKIIMILLSYKDIDVVDFIGYDDEGTYKIEQPKSKEEIILHFNEMDGSLYAEGKKISQLFGIQFCKKRSE